MRRNTYEIQRLFKDGYKLTIKHADNKMRHFENIDSIIDKHGLKCIVSETKRTVVVSYE